MNSEIRKFAVPSVVSALLGEVFPQTRAVLIRPSKEGFIIEFYVDGPVSDEMRESASCVETEVLADIPEDVSVAHALIQLDKPQPIPTQDAVFVFLRKE